MDPIPNPHELELQSTDFSTMNYPVYNVALVNAFLALQMFGAIAFAFIVLSACIFRAVKRQPVWFSFCISWIVYGISYSLLFFAGQQHREHPERILCVVQAASVYGGPLMSVDNGRHVRLFILFFILFRTATATLCLTVHVLLSIISAFYRPPNHRYKLYPIITPLLILFPWLAWIVVVVAALIIGIKHLDHVQMNPQRTYCEITNTLLPKVVAGCVIIMCVVMLCIEVVTARLLYLNRAIKDALGQSLTIAIRISIFTVAMASGGLLGGIFDVLHIDFDIILSILPASAAIIFGTQRDMMKAWMFWTWKCPPITTSGPPVTLTTIEIPKV